MKTLNDYMAMSYRMEIVEDKDEGGIAAAMGSTMPTTANPTAQGMISVISFAKILHFNFRKSNIWRHHSCIKHCKFIKII